MSQKKSKKAISFKAMVINFIRIMLLLTVAGAYFYNRPLIMMMASFGLFFTFIPFFFYGLFRIRIPAEFEIIVLAFLYGLLVFAGAKGFNELFWWWSVLLTFGSAILLGFMGLTLFYVFEKEEIIEASSFVIVFFTFCFAFSVGAFWEVFEFTIDSLFGFNMQGTLTDSMIDLIVNFFGALCVSIFGYFNLKYGKQNFFSSFISGIVRSNASIFRSKRYFEYSTYSIPRLIEKGEGDTVEFKSTLRKNLHTGKTDPNIEHSVLKTIVGYLNSKGGTLLVGVRDNGSVVGIEEDDFDNHDKLKLYLTNNIRKHIGNHYLPFIYYELYPYHDKHVLKIECRKSSKRTFLKWNNEEEFYVRHGSSTIKLGGSDLLDYVKERYESD